MKKLFMRRYQIASQAGIAVNAKRILPSTDFVDGYADHPLANELSQIETHVDNLNQAGHYIKMSLSPSMASQPSMESIRTTESMIRMREEHSKELVIRRAVQVLFRYRARQISQKFNQWKFCTKFVSHFHQELSEFKQQFI